MSTDVAIQTDPPPRDAIPATRDAAPAAPAAEGRVRFIGNATLLIRYAGITVLTDPNLVHRDAEVALGYGLTTTRLTDPALDADELPQPDLVIVSHDHGDHFDDVAADWLEASVPIVTAPGAAAGLEGRGFDNVRPLDTWDATELVRDGARLRVTAVPAQHAPGPLAIAMPDVIGTVLEFWRDGAVRAHRRDDPNLRLYVSGDTVLTDELAEIRDRFGEIDVAFVHLGGMRMMGMTVTMDAIGGVQLINLLQPRITIPIHYNDYGTSRSTLAEFVACVNGAGLADRVRYLRHGDDWELPG